MLIAAALCCGMTFFANVDSVEAQEQQVTNLVQAESAEIQELGKWSHFRDKYLLGRERDRERDYRQPPPPPRDYGSPPPPRHRYGPPPPPPRGHRPPPPR